ncbi:cytochrome P450 [Micromonospora sp. HUAS LYJ1]|uniref:cytochrome P450 n=1 Tax=Micromonospora sp. HUAS LYJ1 TaxID=3061626 RepID=UPI002671F792|nr:cytochrome P450 [Micromonospora sp. HUAS LYJ1]WKU07128.1 cytochrome P450 [Micromonospora sp. HUAS LYJ1]
MPDTTLSDHAAEIDFTDDRFLADPWPVYRRLRQTRPVHFAPGAGAFMVLRHQDVAKALTDPRLTSDYPQRPTRRLFGPSVADTEGAQHRALRRMLVPLFNGQALEQVARPVIREVVEDVVDRVVDATRVDVQRDLTIPVLYGVALRLLGLPPADVDWLHERVSAMTRVMDYPAAPLSTGLAARADLDEYVRSGGIQRRLPGGQPTVLGAIQDRFELDGPATSGSALFFLLAITGTSIASIGSMVEALLSFTPGSWPMPETTPELFTETLRWQPPIHHLIRFAAEDIELHGVHIGRRQPVLLSLASANRDESVFTAPDRWWPQRPAEARSLTFGAGWHSCVGTGLITAEVQELLAVLGSRFTNIRLDAPPSPSRSLGFRGPEHLWVRWEPARTTATSTQTSEEGSNGPGNL